MCLISILFVFIVPDELIEWDDAMHTIGGFLLFQIMVKTEIQRNKTTSLNICVIETVSNLTGVQYKGSIRDIHGSVS